MTEKICYNNINISVGGVDLMEFLVALIVIIVFCKILGISNEMLITGGLALIELAIIAMLLLFLYFCLNLLFTKSKKAEFICKGKPEGYKFNVAYYRIDGEEYPCVFPCESGIAYRTNHTYKVRYSKKLNKVFDIWSILTCVIGLIFSIAAVYFSLQIISFAAIL